jgi:hypothetical protein
MDVSYDGHYRNRMEVPQVIKNRIIITMKRLCTIYMLIKCFLNKKKEVVLRNLISEREGSTGIQYNYIIVHTKTFWGRKHVLKIITILCFLKYLFIDQQINFLYW